MQQHLFRHFQSPSHTGFIENVCITFIDKTDFFIPTKHEDYGRQTLKLFDSTCANMKESVQCLRFYLLLLSSFQFVVFYMPRSQYQDYNLLKLLLLGRFFESQFSYFQQRYYYYSYSVSLYFYFQCYCYLYCLHQY